MKKLKTTPEYLDELFSKKLEEIKGQAVTPESMKLDINPKVTLVGDAKVQVIFHTEAYKKMMFLIQKCPNEIGWHGIVERVSEKRYEITDILVFPQIVTGATVTPDETKYSNWIIEIASSDEYDLNKMRFHGHSHVNMTTSPSGVDTDYQSAVTLNIPDFYIFGIFNKAGSHWMSIFDFESNNLYEKEDIDFLYLRDDADQWAEDVIVQYVENPPKVTYGTANGYSQGKSWSYEMNKWVWPYQLTNSEKASETKKNSTRAITDEMDYEEDYEDWHNKYNKNKGYKGVNYD